MSDIKEIVYANHRNIQTFINEILKKEGVDNFVAKCVSQGLVHASLRGVDSHGIRLLPHYLNGLKSGRINPKPDYKFRRTSQSTGTLDADDTYGHAAGMEAVKHAIELASEAGTGLIAVNKSSHFGAASYFALEISKHDMIGLSFTHSDSLIVPTAAKTKFLGNNPICFTAPCEGEDPICLDMATSKITFNKILQLREEGAVAPPGVGADINGNESEDPNQIVNLLPVGSHKGYGLSLMVEILCSLLTGVPFGPHISGMYNAPIEKKRNLGHFFMAIRIDSFQDLNLFKKRMKQLAEELRNMEPLNSDTSVQVAGDPEKAVSMERKTNGIPLRDVEVDFFTQFASEYSIPAPF